MHEILAAIVCACFIISFFGSRKYYKQMMTSKEILVKQYADQLSFFVDNKIISIRYLDKEISSKELIDLIDNYNVPGQTKSPNHSLKGRM